MFSFKCLKSKVGHFNLKNYNLFKLTLCLKWHSIYSIENPTMQLWLHGFLFFFYWNWSYQNFTVHVKVWIILKKKTGLKRRRVNFIFKFVFYCINTFKTLFGLWTIFFSKPIKAITYVCISKEGIEGLPQVGESHIMHLYFAETALVVLLIQVQYINQRHIIFMFLCKQ